MAALGAAGVGATAYVLLPSRFKSRQREREPSTTNELSNNSAVPRDSGGSKVLGEIEALLADLLQWSLFKVDHGVGFVKVREGGEFWSLYIGKNLSTRIMVYNGHLITVTLGSLDFF